MSKVYNIFLEEILTTINKIQDLLFGKTFEEFMSNYHLVENVIRYLNIIGEASKHIPDDVKQELQDISWDEIIELRNILNNPEHINCVWNFVTLKLLEIKEQISSLTR